MGKAPEENHYTFKYHFLLGDGIELSQSVIVDKETLISAINTPTPFPEWTALEFNQCSHCTLKNSAHCPIAIRLIEPLALFNPYISYNKVTVTVTTDERTYSKKTDLQDGIRSLFGLIMATSSCPSMEPFRPMARFHLPFSTIDETVYRVTSMYLLSEFFLHEEESHIPFNMENLFSLYDIIQNVNMGIIQRLRAVAEKDSTLNAVNILDSYAALVPMYIQKKLDQLKILFAENK